MRQTFESLMNPQDPQYSECIRLIYFETFLKSLFNPDQEHPMMEIEKLLDPHRIQAATLDIEFVNKIATLSTLMNISLHYRQVNPLS